MVNGWAFPSMRERLQMMAGLAGLLLLPSQTQLFAWRLMLCIFQESLHALMSPKTAVHHMIFIIKQKQ